MSASSPLAVGRLVAVLVEARAFLARPGSQSLWSGWRTQADALAEIDSLVESLRAGRPPAPSALRVLFAGAGPIQDWSEDNGWGEEFIGLASRFDAALADAYPHSARTR